MLQLTRASALTTSALPCSLLLAASLLAGCGGGGSDSAAPATATDEAQRDAPPQQDAPDDIAEEVPEETEDGPRSVIFVGNNWEGVIDVIDASSYQRLGRISGIPDQKEREKAIALNPLDLLFFQGIRVLIGEGNHQYVDDMYSSPDGRLLIVSRPSYADVVAIDVVSGEIAWRFEVDGYRSDHMALSPDGTQVAWLIQPKNEPEKHVGKEDIANAILKRIELTS